MGASPFKISSVCPRAGISSCATSISPQVAHFLPSLIPASVQVASLPAIASSVCPKASPSVTPQRVQVLAALQVASAKACSHSALGTKSQPASAIRTSARAIIAINIFIMVFIKFLLFHVFIMSKLGDLGLPRPVIINLFYLDSKAFDFLIGYTVG